MAISSRHLYQKLVSAGIEFPPQARSIILIMHYNEAAMMNVVMNVTTRDGEYVRDFNNNVETIEKHFKFYEADKPMKCSCCGRFFRP